MIHIQSIFTPFQAAHIGVACIDAYGICLAANAQFGLYTQYDVSEIVGQSLNQLSASEHEDASRINAVFNGELNSYTIKRSILRKDGSSITASVSVSPISDSSQDIIAAIVILTEITSDPEQVLELKKLSYAVENSGSAVMITDANGHIEYTNPRFSEVTGYSYEEVTGKNPKFLKSGQNNPEQYVQLWQSLMEHRQWRGTLINRRKDGSLFWSFQSISPVVDNAGTLVNIVSVSEDISALKENEKRMEQLAFYDSLTGLGNRRKFRFELAKLINQEPENVSALLLLDLDHFKQINDTLGHDMGDELLAAIANRLKFCTHTGCTIYRLGGDEFTLIIKRVSSEASIESLSKEIISLLAQPITIGPHEIVITVSLGIAIVGKDGSEAGTLLKNADLAMYAAKRSGRNTFAFFQPLMDFAVKRSLALEIDLRHAVEHGGMDLLFQPQVNLRNGQIVGVEALARWHHPTEGNISPEEFILKAETTGVILPLGNWVIQQSCRAIKELHSLGYNELSISINISARQFEDAGLLASLEKSISDTQCDPSWIVLEITEGLMLTNSESSIETMHAIKKLGVALAIDDFGTGFSSLSYLKQMPINQLKVDKSFVKDLPNDENNAVITSTILAMAEQLKLSTLAEGIESADHVDFLLDNNCCIGQGFYYCKPLSLSQLTDTLSSNNGLFTPKAALF